MFNTPTLSSLLPSFFASFFLNTSTSSSLSMSMFNSLCFLLPCYFYKFSIMFSTLMLLQTPKLKKTHHFLQQMTSTTIISFIFVLQLPTHLICFLGCSPSLN
jgi:hypothetical protein